MDISGNTQKVRKSMKSVFEKIIEKLEEEKMFYFLTIANTGDEKLDYTYEKVGNALDKAIEIVKQEAEQHNNGWIPCNEKLPELRKDVLVTVKYTGFMGMHGYWIKTGHMEAENDWWGDCAGGEVIAWMELPSAYRQKEK